MNRHLSLHARLDRLAPPLAYPHNLTDEQLEATIRDLSAKGSTDPTNQPELRALMSRRAQGELPADDSAMLLDLVREEFQKSASPHERHPQ